MRTISYPMVISALLLSGCEQNSETTPQNFVNLGFNMKEKALPDPSSIRYNNEEYQYYYDFAITALRLASSDSSNCANLSISNEARVQAVSGDAIRFFGYGCDGLSGAMTYLKTYKATVFEYSTHGVRPIKVDFGGPFKANVTFISTDRRRQFVATFTFEDGQLVDAILRSHLMESGTL